MARFRANPDASFKYYRILSRQVCNFALPPQLLGPEATDADAELPSEDTVASAETADDRHRALAKMREAPELYFTAEALEAYSPKFRAALLNMGEGNQFVYSFFVDVAGLAVFGEVLKAAGYAQYRVKRAGGEWIEDVDLVDSAEPGGPKLPHKGPYFAMFTGAESPDERECYRLLYNSEWRALERGYPAVVASLRERFGPDATNLRGEILKVLMASKAGAQGISLQNTRQVHILEPYWNYAIMEQVIGRAMRICSSSRLPPEERTVKVNIYMTVFNDLINTNENNAALLRRKDTLLKRFVADVAPTEPGTSDEFLYEAAYEKKVIGDQFLDLLKQAAFDCEIHRQLHSRGESVAHCMRMVAAAPGDLAWHADIADDERDATLDMNLTTDTVLLQKVRIKDFVFLYRPDTREVFHLGIWEFSKRLLPLGSFDGARLELLV
jgi:hypothetical protein